MQLSKNDMASRFGPTPASQMNRRPLSIQSAALATFERASTVSSGSLEDNRRPRQSCSFKRLMQRPDIVLLMEEALRIGCVDSSDIIEDKADGDN
jgi:hypothetical protein